MILLKFYKEFHDEVSHLADKYNVKLQNLIKTFYTIFWELFKIFSYIYDNKGTFGVFHGNLDDNLLLP